MRKGALENMTGPAHTKGKRDRKKQHVTKPNEYI